MAELRVGAKIAQVVIAHQSAIPNYRIRFYELLEKVRPPNWEFHVVYDRNQNQKVHGHVGYDSNHAFNFPVIEAPVSPVRLPLVKNLRWQNFTSNSRKADVLVLDTTLSNLAYPVNALLRRRACRLVLWGHTGNLNTTSRTFARIAANTVKRQYLRSCDAFFAYTEAEKRAAIQIGLDERNVFALNNTVDIVKHRSRYLKLKEQREHLRQKMGFASDSKVILVVGRLIPERRIEFMMETFRRIDSTQSWHLVIVGGGPELTKVKTFQSELGSGKVTVTGSISDSELLAEYYTAADAFVLPGMVGLAPLEAMCFELPVFAFDLGIHSPEIEYLTLKNSSVLPGNTTPAEFAKFLTAYFTSADYELESSSYQTIQHLNLDNMVQRFCRGISEVVDSLPL